MEFPFLNGRLENRSSFTTRDCTVFKPSSATSLSVLELALLTQNIIPKGVFNVITGSGSVAEQFMPDHKDLRKLAFTRSTEVDINVAKAATEKLIPSTLKLGGKSVQERQVYPWDIFTFFISFQQSNI